MANTTKYNVGLIMIAGGESISSLCKFLTVILVAFLPTNKPGEP